MKHPNKLDQQLDNLRTLQQSYDAIAGAAEAYNTGKVELAQNITAKGVQASATETLPDLADKVLDIQQTTTVIDGGDMYSAQLTGDGALWDLYQILAQMKSRFMGAGQYACLIVCEYYKGYDSLQLQGADAHYTCDGDFYDTSMPLHVWHDSDNDKMNRWVCFLYAAEGARLDITNTAISPRSMYVGGHIGTIEYFVNGRLTDLVCGVEETDVVDNFATKSYTQPWSGNIIIRNVKYSVSGVRHTFTNTGVIDIKLDDNLAVFYTGVGNSEPIYAKNANAVCVRGIEHLVSNNMNDASLLLAEAAAYISIPDLKSLSVGSGNLGVVNLHNNKNIQEIHTSNITSIAGINSKIFINGEYATKLSLVTVGGLTTNLNADTWNPTDELSNADRLSNLVDNIKNGILARVSDRMGLSQLVFTVSTNMYNNIASEEIEWQGETMSLADAFLTKNWLLAGA